jgi:Formate hydrogenlyase maturation protein HycH.
MTRQVTIHALNQRFLERDVDESAPEQVGQIMYYSLAIGHHVGVIDCFEKVIECSADDYQQWIEYLPEGDARRKMAGLLKFGEIVIDNTHINLLGSAFVAIKDQVEPPFKDWTMTLLKLLQAMTREPAMYLMVKAR